MGALDAPNGCVSLSASSFRVKHSAMCSFYPCFVHPSANTKGELGAEKGLARKTDV